MEPNEVGVVEPTYIIQQFREGMMSKPILTVTPDRRLIIERDIYEAAREFWQVVIQNAPPDWVLERAEE